MTHYREVPFWPTLPRRSVEETMLRQFEHPLTPRNASTLGPFLEAARGLSPIAVKGQVTGPITRCLGSRNGLTMGEALRSSARAACEVIRALGRLGSPVLLFIDEPAIHTLYDGLVRRERRAESALAELVTVAKRAGAIVGVHTCGPPPVEPLVRAEPDLLSVDVVRYREPLLRAREELRGYVRRGGAFAFGVVPTSVPAGFASERAARFLVRDLEAALGDRLAVRSLLRRSLITPACGTGQRRLADERAASEALRAIQAALRHWLEREERRRSR